MPNNFLSVKEAVRQYLHRIYTERNEVKNCLCTDITYYYGGECKALRIKSRKVYLERSLCKHE